MSKQPHNLDLLPFSKGNATSHRSSNIQNHSESGWSNRDFCQFCKQQISSLAFQLAGLENHLISNAPSTRDMTQAYSIQHDPVCRTRHMLKQMEHAQRLLDLTESLKREPETERFDVQSLINEAWENTATIDQMIDLTTRKPMMVEGDREQIYVAVACLMFELSQYSSEVSISYVTKGEQWELEFADSSDDLETDSVAIRTAAMVVRKHGGDLMIDECPQGGHAFNFVFPARSVKKAA